MPALTNIEELPSREQLQTYKARGIRALGVPIFALLSLDEQQRLVASNYALQARGLGFELLGWTLERSGPLSAEDKGFYYQGLNPAITREGDLMRVMNVLARDLGVSGLFTDWAAPVSFYANCLL